MIAQIEKQIRASLDVSHFEIHDDSEMHASHSGNPSGGGHFSALIVSADFDNLPLLKRHRLVYGALGDLMGGSIHAFSMKTLTPDEFNTD